MVEMNMIKTAAASKKGQKASFVSRVGMTVLTVVLIILFFFIMMLVSRIQGTARVVNYAGLVRGDPAHHQTGRCRSAAGRHD